MADTNKTLVKFNLFLSPFSIDFFCLHFIHIEHLSNHQSHLNLLKMLLDIDLNAPCENSHPLHTLTPLMDCNKPLPNHETQQGSNNQGAVTF